MKILKAGTLVVVNGVTVDVKEYMGHGLYQGNEVVTGKRVYFDRNGCEFKYRK